MRRPTLHLLALVIVLLLGACSPAPQPSPVPPTRTPMPTFTPTAVVPTSVPAATSAPAAPAATTATRAPTAAPAATTAPAATAQPVATAAPAATAAPTATSTPTVTRLRATQSVNVRLGPATAYNLLGQLQQGATHEITGMNSGGTWLQFNFQGDAGWVLRELVAVEGDMGRVRVAQNIPALPTAAPVPTRARSPRPRPSRPRLRSPSATRSSSPVARRGASRTPAPPISTAP